MEIPLHVLENVALKCRQDPRPDTQKMGDTRKEVLVDVVMDEKEETLVGATEKPCTFL